MTKMGDPFVFVRINNLVRRNGGLGQRAEREITYPVFHGPLIEAGTSAG
jgi:hypothetical protein